MKKRNLVVAVLGLFFLMAGTAAAEMYVEGYMGYNFTVTSPNPLEIDANPAFKGPTKLSLEYPRVVSHYLLGGGKLGIWFSRQGFPRYDFPEWMKYLGFYLDVNYHGLNYGKMSGSRRMYINPSPPPLHFQHYKFLGDGNITTIGFMFACRYGFNPTEKVPFGRWQPYVAVGPAIMITSLKPRMKITPNSSYEYFPVATDGSYNPQNFDGNIQFVEVDPSRQTVVSLGLATELGLRFMVTKFLSVDTSVKYRYTTFATSYDLEVYGITHQLRYAPQFNIFSVQAGVAYHF